MIEDDAEVGASGDDGYNLHASDTKAKYGKASAFARSAFRGENQCKLFCGGARCKYCTSRQWTPEQAEVSGIYSNWITPDILAMARPTLDRQDSIITALVAAGIRSIVNVQTRDEHAYCGPSLHKSGYSYDPQAFMDQGIFFYNFEWDDYSIGSLSNILDMVKVMQFALKEGKVAVHCHAGLGRTGTFIGCYLVFNHRWSADYAITLIRKRRPNSIQSQGQLNCIYDFASYMRPLWCVYPAGEVDEFTVTAFLARQRQLLHGEKGRRFRNIPQVLYLVCCRLSSLAGLDALREPQSLTQCSSPSNGDIPPHSSGEIQAEDEGDSGEPTDIEVVTQEEVMLVANSLVSHRELETQERVQSMAEKLNKRQDGEVVLKEEADPVVLSALLWRWLDELKEPLLTPQYLSNIRQSTFSQALSEMDKGTAGTITFLLDFTAQFSPLPLWLLVSLCAQLVHSLTHCAVDSQGITSGSIVQMILDWLQESGDDAQGTVSFSAEEVSRWCREIICRLHDDEDEELANEDV